MVPVHCPGTVARPWPGGPSAPGVCSGGMRISRLAVPAVLAALILAAGLTATLPAMARSACVTSNPSGSCGPYAYRGITNSNGYNTYVGNNCWADPRCRQTITARNPGSWTVRAREPAGNTSVRTYPDVQQLFNNWTGRGWNGSGTMADTPVRGLAWLYSSYAEVTPGGGTIAQFAYDIWMSRNGHHASEIMIWTDNHNRGSGGAQFKASAVIFGQRWTLYQDGSDELIWSLGRPGTFARQTHGTVHILALLHWLQAHGYTAQAARIEQVDAGWEICSTGRVPRMFRVSHFTLHSVAR